ncbi:hypothetical protein HMPREF3227_02521 [Corynebacterium sp. CMW7794]|nr:hypothetical protein HMPREF3227_02521 [Corynebacterium sp. CMW7794]
MIALSEIVQIIAAVTASVVAISAEARKWYTTIKDSKKRKK